MARNRSPNAPRLFPPALHPNRDAFKNVCLFRCLPKIGGAAVEEGSAAIDANRDTRRRRSCTGWREGLSRLGYNQVGRQCSRDSGHRILDQSFAAACSNDRDADKTAVRFFAFAGAAFLRTCNCDLLAEQRISPNQPFKWSVTRQFQTDLSLHTDPTIRSRALPPLPFRTFADAASPRRCRRQFSVLQQASPDRTFSAVNFGKFQTAFSLRPDSTIGARTFLPVASPQAMTVMVVVPRVVV